MQLNIWTLMAIAVAIGTAAYMVLGNGGACTT